MKSNVLHKSEALCELQREAATDMESYLLITQGGGPSMVYIYIYTRSICFKCCVAYSVISFLFTIHILHDFIE